MSYRLKFFKSALKEWEKLDPYIRIQFKAHLKKRLENPRIESARLKGYPNLYKIKLQALGYRLAYSVEDQELCVYVIAVGRRDQIYEVLHQRLAKS
jgi:mRNA interferase RelE/StbE